MWFCSIFGAVLPKFLFYTVSCGIAVLQNQAVCGIQKCLGNFNAVSSFPCYSVLSLYAFLCGFAVFIPPLHPPIEVGGKVVRVPVEDSRGQRPLQQ